MKEQYTILIVDRNARVRELLKREMEAEGYIVKLARNGKETLSLAFKHAPLHLIIIDPDLPDADELNILEKLKDRIPPLPLIMHGFASENDETLTVLDNSVTFVEKGGRSIEALKKVAAEMLQKTVAL